MKYFKFNGDVYAFESDGSQDDYIPVGAVPMTEEEIEEVLSPKQQPYVPSTVTMRQARLALLQEGLLDNVEALLSSLEGPEGQAARIEWQYSSEVHRHRPFVTSLGIQLGLDDNQLDALFIAASQID